RPLGQLARTYLLAEAPDGLVLVDQHAAHERVLYERVRADAEAGGTGGAAAARQPLLAATFAPLSAVQNALALEHADALAALGFELGATDGPGVLVRAVPALLSGRDPGIALVEYLERLGAADERLASTDRAAAALACRAAVMAGDPLDGAQQRALLRELEACAEPHTCPHGRPTLVHVSGEAIARSFLRR
ncbi:MAG: DNA mismatch repair protein MutL, partial [Chloroflexi bacterium]|nr:DNA mismatch repair protein MutL [Chloroflexota bacterium]